MKVRCEPGCGWSLRDKFCESPKGSTVVIAPCGLHPCWGRDRDGNIGPKSSKHHLCARWRTRQMVWTRGARRHFATVVEANRQPSAKRLGGPNVGSEGALPTGDKGAVSGPTASSGGLIDCSHWACAIPLAYWGLSIASQESGHEWTATGLCRTSFGGASLHWMTERGARIAASLHPPGPAFIREWATHLWVKVDSDGHRR